MIIKCNDQHFENIYEIINDGASAYKDVIPADRWHEPYMSKLDLQKQIDEHVEFYGYLENDKLIGIMGIQPLKEVTLIRHAYIRTDQRNKGIGSLLLNHLTQLTTKPVLIGTWATATWAIAFYEKHKFILLDQNEKIPVLKKYWNIPERQVETSVVLADSKWFLRK